MRHVLLLAAALLIGIVPLAAQDTEEAGGLEINPTDATHVRFAHFAPGANGVDVLVDGELSGFTDLQYPAVTSWLTLPAGSHDVAIVEAGGDIEQSVIGPTPLTFNAQTWYTVAMAGSPSEDTLTTFILEEDTDSLLAGTARVTFFNAMENSSVDFYENERAFTTGMSFGETLTSEHDAAAVMFQVVSSGDDPAVLAEMSDVQLRESYNHLIVALGIPGDAELFISQTPRAQFLMGQGALEAPGTIVQAVEGENLAGDFEAAIEAAGLTETLSSGGPYTLFVPAEFQMNDLPATEGAELERILSHHIVYGEILSQDLVNATRLTTLAGDELSVDVRDNTIYVDDARVLTVNIPATNGVVHLISAPLTPPDEE